MTRWALLLRAVNLGPRNKLAMADLRSLLTDLGHDDVRTYLNSGNATFTSSRRSRTALVEEVEAGLRDRLGLGVRATVRTMPELEQALAGVPEGDSAYMLIAFLLDRPKPAAREEVEQWDVAPDRVVLGDDVAYLAYSRDVHTSKLQASGVEKRLGVAATARTPATVRKLLP